MAAERPLTIYYCVMGHGRWVRGVTGARRHIGGAPGRHLAERFSRAHSQLILGSVQVLKWPPTSRPERAATSTSPLWIPHDGLCEALALEFERGRCAGSACRIYPTSAATRRSPTSINIWEGGRAGASDGTWPPRHPQRTVRRCYGGTSRPRVLAHPGGAPAPPGHSILYLCPSRGIFRLRT